MMLQLVLAEQQNFFTWKSYYPGAEGTHYTFFRVFTPIFLFLGLSILYFQLFGKSVIKTIIDRFKMILFSKKGCFKKYLLFLLLSLAILSLTPSFLLLVRNLNTQYGFFDADSYISLVALMRRGDFNASYVTEGGLQFGKYYMVTMPTLILTYFLGLRNIVAAYNLVITLLVFLMIINTILAFFNFFIIKKAQRLEEIIALLFVWAFVLLSTRALIFGDYFNFGPLLQVYCSGFYGAVGGMFLFSSAVFLISFLIRKEVIDESQIHLIFITIFVFGTMISLAYFNLLLLYVPITSLLLLPLLTKRSTLKKTAKLFLLFESYLLISYLNFTSLNIFSDFNMEANKKFLVLQMALPVSFWLLFWLNKKKADFSLKLLLKLRPIFVPLLFFLPFVLYFKTAKNIYNAQELYKIESLGFPLKLLVLDVNNTRMIFITLLLGTLALGSIFLTLLRLIGVVKRKKIYYPLGVLFFITSVFFIHNYNQPKSLPLQYPSFYDEQLRITDFKNPYVFDENGVRVTYNQYLVDVIKYFEKNHLDDMLYFLVSKTPSRGIYEHGLLQRILASRGHRLEGITIKDFKENEQSLIPDWAKIKLSQMVIEDYDDFIENIFEIEKETRPWETAFENRYLIIDNNFPPDTLTLINESPFFHKEYENKLYKIYKLGKYKFELGP